jgi:hypothetical protein
LWVGTIEVDESVWMGTKMVRAVVVVLLIGAQVERFRVAFASVSSAIKGV